MIFMGKSMVSGSDFPFFVNPLIYQSPHALHLHLARDVQCHQGRAAGRVHRGGSTVQTQGVGDAVGGDRCVPWSHPVGENP